MSERAYKTCLFGGALMSAGIANVAAGQAQFIILDNAPGYDDVRLTGFAYEAAEGSPVVSGGTATDFIAYGGPPPYSPPGVQQVVGSTPEAYGIGQINDQSLFGYATVDPSADGYLNYASGGGYMYFTVSEDAVLTATWDFTTLDAFLGSDLVVIDFTNGVLLLNIDVNNAIGALSGTTNIPLIAGNNYGVVVDAVASDSDGRTAGSNFAVVTIPAPSGAAVLGLAGLIAARRRRA